MKPLLLISLIVFGFLVVTYLVVTCYQVAAEESEASLYQESHNHHTIDLQCRQNVQSVNTNNNLKLAPK